MEDGFPFGHHELRAIVDWGHVGEMVSPGVPLNQFSSAANSSTLRAVFHPSRLLIFRDSSYGDQFTALLDQPH